MRVAVIGAGISGLTCASRLAAHGLDVTVFEKSRGLSGRMATRRGEGGLQWDHGAQYFTVRDDRFKEAVDQWMQAGIVEPWNGKIAAITGDEIQWKHDQPIRYVGTPQMSAIGRQLAEALPAINLRKHVAKVQRHQRRWRLESDQAEELGEFEVVISSVPAPQAALLLEDAPILRRTVSQVTMHGCWAAMVSLQEPLQVEFDGAFVNQSILSWISRNSSKPGRSPMPETWVLHGSSHWSDENIDRAPDDILPEMLVEFRSLASSSGGSEVRLSQAACHRWRFAIPDEPLNDRLYYDSDLRIGVCGDWCDGPRVEGAYLSGLALAERLLQSTAE